MQGGWAGGVMPLSLITGMHGDLLTVSMMGGGLSVTYADPQQATTQHCSIEKWGVPRLLFDHRCAP